MLSPIITPPRLSAVAAGSVYAPGFADSVPSSDIDRFSPTFIPPTLSAVAIGISIPPPAVNLPEIYRFPCSSKVNASLSVPSFQPPFPITNNAFWVLFLRPKPAPQEYDILTP